MPIMILLTAWLLCVVSPMYGSKQNTRPVVMSLFLWRQGHVESLRVTHKNSHGLSAAMLIDSFFFFSFFIFFPQLWLFPDTTIENTRRKGTNQEKLCILKWWNSFSPLKSPSLKCNEQGSQEGHSCMPSSRHGGQNASAALSRRVEEKQEPLMETSSFHYTSICSSQQRRLAAAHMVPSDRQTGRRRDRQTGGFPVKTGQNVSLARPINGNIQICSAVLCTSRNAIDICD